MQVHRIQCLSVRTLVRNQGADVEDLPWETLDGIHTDEKRANAIAAELEAAEDGRYTFRVVSFDLVRAA